MANIIEEAKSGRAACRTCKKPIAKGELRLGVETPNQFGDTPSMQWHHLLCAASKLPAELKAAMDDFGGTIPNKDELDKAMDDAIKGGKAKPGGFPHIDKAPTGRAKCMECGEAIAKDSWRIAVEREIELGGNMGRSAGYLHPKCITANLENVGGDKEEFVEQLRANSRIPGGDLEAVILEVNDN
jgi:poly [ADP-ribose] polymerase